ncbi:MAG: hypothetical protein U0Q16_06750 [Bryobacteraceae bacterium]
MGGDTFVPHEADRSVREGWESAAKVIAEAGDDELVVGDFGNEADADWSW